MNVKRLNDIQAAKLKRAVTLHNYNNNNGSIIPTSPFVIKRAVSLPVDFELVLAFWKTKENFETNTNVSQVNASSKLYLAWSKHGIIYWENLMKTHTNKLFFVLLSNVPALIYWQNIVKYAFLRKYLYKMYLKILVTTNFLINIIQNTTNAILL